eukprot:scaffold72166_cov52-Prasinocladus_malaysianus.AAC.1
MIILCALAKLIDLGVLNCSQMQMPIYSERAVKSGFASKVWRQHKKVVMCKGKCYGIGMSHYRKVMFLSNGISAFGGLSPFSSLFSYKRLRV